MPMNNENPEENPGERLENSERTQRASLREELERIFSVESEPGEYQTRSAASHLAIQFFELLSREAKQTNTQLQFKHTNTFRWS